MYGRGELSLKKESVQAGLPAFLGGGGIASEELLGALHPAGAKATGAVAHATRSPLDLASHGQSSMDLAFWTRASRHAERLRPTRASSSFTGTAGLARQRIHS